MNDIHRLQLQISEAFRQIEQGARERGVLDNNVRALLQAQTNAPVSPAANQLWNGELGHSVNSWSDSAFVTTDVAKECALFFSHDAPAPAQQLLTTDARTNSVNNTLKARAYGALTDHSTYSNQYSDWDAARGVARITGTKSVDTPLPQNSVEAGMTCYVNMIVARRNRFIEIPETLRLFCGIWDNTAGQRDWIAGSLGFAAAPIDATGTTERRYRLNFETDRGYSILSPEVVVAGYSDAEFAAGKEVDLSWNNAAGYLRVTIWRYTPATGSYHVLEELSSGANTFIDNNSFQNRVPAPVSYPSGTETTRKAVFYTSTGNLVDMAIDGGVWSTFHGVVSVPDNYAKAATTDRQWLRIGQTESCNLFVEGITTDGSAVITAPAAVFESAYSALFAGLVAEIYDEFDALIVSTTVAARTSDTQLTLSATVPAGGNRKIRVAAGGFHGILLDKIHLGFQDNVSFAPNPLDARTLQPVATPSIGQGTVGDGGRGSGGLCVADDTPILLGGFFASSGSVLARDLQLNSHVEGESAAPNFVWQIKRGAERVRAVRTANGVELDVTNSHRFKMNLWDQAGTPLYMLRVGDRIATKIDGRTEFSKIVMIGPLSADRRPVVTPRLKNGEYYIAGRWRPAFWQKVLIKFRLMRARTGGAYSHNSKPQINLD